MTIHTVSCSLFPPVKRTSASPLSFTWNSMPLRGKSSQWNDNGTCRRHTVEFTSVGLCKWSFRGKVHLKTPSAWEQNLIVSCSLLLETWVSQTNVTFLSKIAPKVKSFWFLLSDISSEGPKAIFYLPERAELLFQSKVNGFTAWINVHPFAFNH